MRNIDAKLLKKRYEALEDEVGFDYILREYHDHEMSEYVISIGGDVLTYRVYGTDEMKVYAR